MFGPRFATTITVLLVSAMAVGSDLRGRTNAQDVAGARMLMLGDEPLVDMVWNPTRSTAYVGNVVELRVVARTDRPESQTIGTIELALEWDSQYLRLLGVRDDGPYSWLSSGFPDDSALDGINDTFLDGNALYEALSGFATPAVATPTGLHVTTFRFQALQETSSTAVRMAEQLGTFGVTAVFGADFLGQNVTGSLGSAAVRICVGQPSDDDQDGVEDCTDLCRGTPPGEPVDADGCSCSQIVCDDGQHCNGAEGCMDGLCRPGESPNCNDGNECTADSCDPTANEGAGACVHEPVLAGSRCGDPTEEQCDHPDACDAEGRCLPNLESAGTPCLDDLFCNGQEACDGTGTCQRGNEPCTDPLLSLCDEDTNECVECLSIGDVTGDKRVNLLDYGYFPNCVTGPVGPKEPPAYPQACRCFDSDDDGDIDVEDFAAFQRSFGGM